ncbi:uncharacterized protein LOC115682244 [Syzygium oleosum]|uniref:uncharacterized protein LOC115682244 n=1 Tax=Syzygium oleosum TaxID=219896 RepID=UPI0011D18E9D|nr:uncharacterized protein LOC115682244 [Syzygium oleosum]
MGGEVSKNTKDTSYTIHPEHELTLMEPRDPFYCTACKETGFSTGYGCSKCVVRVHQECKSPSPESSLRLKRKKHSLKFYPDMNAENGKPRFCAVCSQPVRGCGYRSSSGKNCHPSCLTLPKSIMVNSAELRLANKMMLDCKWCGVMKRYIGKVKIRSWSYARENCEYHVGCVKDMVIESWRNGEFVPAKEGDGAGQMHIKVDLSSRGISGNLGSKLLELARKGTMAAMTGDPTDLLG